MAQKKKKNAAKKAPKDTYVDVNPDPTSEEFVYDESERFHRQKDAMLLAAGTSYKRNFNNDAEEVLGVASDSDDDDEEVAKYEKRLKRVGGVGSEALGNDGSSDEDEEEYNDEEMLPSDVDDDALEEHDARMYVKKRQKCISDDDLFSKSLLQNRQETTGKSREVVDSGKKTERVGSVEDERIISEIEYFVKHLLETSSAPMTARRQKEEPLILRYIHYMNLYLALKASGEDAHKHPVTGKILELKSMIEGNFDACESSEEDVEMQEQLDGDVEDEVEEDGAQRPISKTMIQNRGTVPYRKKENKNPRVKHRNKYKKALVRMKGKGSRGRKEITKYAGELTGINPGLIKSVRFK